jgi:hypothetical protein
MSAACVSYPEVLKATNVDSRTEWTRHRGPANAFPRFEHRWFELPQNEFEVAIKEAGVFLDEISTRIQHQLPMP